MSEIEKPKEKPSRIWRFFVGSSSIVFYFVGLLSTGIMYFEGG